MASDHAQRVGEFAQELCRLADGLPRRVGAGWIQIGRDDGIEIDRYELLAVDAEPAKFDVSAGAVDLLGLDEYLERDTLQAGRVTKMVEIPEKILDLEPHHGRSVAVGAVGRQI